MWVFADNKCHEPWNYFDALLRIVYAKEIIFIASDTARETYTFKYFCFNFHSTSRINTTLLVASLYLKPFYVTIAWRIFHEGFTTKINCWENKRSVLFENKTTNFVSSSSNNNRNKGSIFIFIGFLTSMIKNFLFFLRFCLNQWILRFHLNF